MILRFHFKKLVLKHLISEVQYQDVLNLKRLLVIGYGRWIIVKEKVRKLE